MFKSTFCGNLKAGVAVAKGDLDAIAQSSGGDLRQATAQLQFFCAGDRVCKNSAAKFRKVRRADCIVCA